MLSLKPNFEVTEFTILHVDTPLVSPMPFSRVYQLERHMQLKLALHDGDYRQVEVIVPKGFSSDGASIPAFLWQLIGTPYAPEFLTAAIIHDWMCVNNWNVHTMSVIFKRLLKLSNVPSSKADAMYVAVLAYKSIA